MWKNWKVEIVLDKWEDEPGERPTAYFERYQLALNHAQHEVDRGNDVLITVGPENGVMRGLWHPVMVKARQVVLDRCDEVNGR